MSRSFKTGKSNRETYTYFGSDGTKLMITPGHDGVTEADIQILHELDDLEFNNNRRHEETQLRFDTLNAAPDDSSDLAEPADPAADCLEQLIQALERDDLLQSLSHLEPRQRDLIQKIFYQGMKVVDVAREQHVSHVAVLDRLKRIYKKLEKYLD